ncbi:MAG: methyltransferase, cyclopropane fatty acid synthase [Microgenomates group bacterium Gr01-1014_16]|nr:MAG: methyltransferase, cyclopropane fatty acid synthase [Microgenomates group bacterium Gr01-1014_16]
MKTHGVDPRLYDTKYYLQECSTCHLKKVTSLIPIKSDYKVLDIGCGRGELATWAASKGCSVIGIDYSSAAIKIANKVLLRQPTLIRQRVKFKSMNLNNLEFTRETFDVVTCVEVLEHIYPDEQEQLLKQIKVILKPGGYLFIHTAPSKWFLDITYRFWCYPIGCSATNIWNFVFNKNYGNLVQWSKLRNNYHKTMHVNEPDYFSLKKLFSKYGFSGQILSTNVTVNKPIVSWKDALFNFLVYLSPLSNHPPLCVFWGNDYYAILRHQ